MAIVKGQWYQWKLYPDRFYHVSVVTASYIQLYPYDTTRYPIMNLPPSYVQANFRLLSGMPQNFLIDGATTSKTSVTRAQIIDSLPIWGSASAKGAVSHSADLLDTTLRGKVRNLIRVTRSTLYLSRIQARGSLQAHSSVLGLFTPHPTLGGHVLAHSATKGSDFTVYPLGGHVASHGSVVQAQAN